MPQTHDSRTRPARKVDPGHDRWTKEAVHQRMRRREAVLAAIDEHQRFMSRSSRIERGRSALRRNLLRI